MKVRIKKLDERAVIPQYSLTGDAGFDLYTIEPVALAPNQTVLVRTGLAFEVPEGYEMQIRPRSGVSSTTPLRVANAPGTVDSNFRGEVQIIIHNTGGHPFYIEARERIAQGVMAPIVTAVFELVEDLSNTNRGNKGFGSSGGFLS